MIHARAHMRSCICTHMQAHACVRMRTCCRCCSRRAIVSLACSKARLGSTLPDSSGGSGAKAPGCKACPCMCCSINSASSGGCKQAHIHAAIWAGVRKSTHAHAASGVLQASAPPGCRLGSWKNNHRHPAAEHHGRKASGRGPSN